MQATTHHRARWSIFVILVGVVAAMVVHVVTADVVWATVPLLLTVAAVRQLLRRGATSR